MALVKACKKHGVSLADAAALAWAESEYDPRARSKKGALGLMQLMPPTFKSIGGKEPFDPFENADKGVKYFKKMLLRFKGNKRLALAAYNAGPRNVRQKKAHEWKEPKNHFTKFCAKKIELLAQ